MFKSFKKFNLFFGFVFTVFLGLQNGQVAYGAYEIYVAKTIHNETEQKIQPEQYIPTYNDLAPNEEKYENTITEFLSRKIQEKKAKKAKKKGSNSENLTSEEVVEQGKISNSVQEAIKYRDEVVPDENKLQVNADKIAYDDIKGEIHAKGNVEINAVAQKITLKADDALFDKANQKIYLSENVKVIKKGVEMVGETLTIDLNEENILMDNPTTHAYSFIIKAQEGYLIDNDVEMLNGTIKSSRPMQYAFETQSFQKYENVAMDYIRNKHIDRSNLKSSIKQSYDIKAKEIVLTSYKDHDVLILKKADVYYNKHKIAPTSDIEIITDKTRQVTEISGPEAGTFPNYGTYIGYGYCVRLPKGQILKLVPNATVNSGHFGGGLIARHKTPNSSIEAGYSTSTKNPVIRGRYHLGKNLQIQYGRQAYISEGFMGSRRAGYAAQLQYLKSFINEDLGLRFSHGAYAGFYTDYSRHKQENQFATTRFRYMADLRKSIFKFENKEQDLSIELNGMAQAAATVYGSGDVFGIARIGPYITTRIRRWESSIGYLISGTHGATPFVFDRYRYGKSTIMLNEKINFTDKFAFGFRANITPMKDNYKKDLITEARFYAMLGPQDLKLVASYDFVRSIAQIDFLFLLGTDSTRINFDKLITKNADGSIRKRDFYMNSKRVNLNKLENM